MDKNFQRIKNINNYIHSVLYKKYFRSVDVNNIFLINKIIFNESCHLVAEFKEFLIYEDNTEFLKYYYLLNQSFKKLKRFLNYYEKYSIYYPNYIILHESKYLYRNIIKKQRIIENYQNKKKEIKNYTKNNEEGNKKNNNDQKQGSSLSKNKNKEIKSTQSNSVPAQSNAEPVIFNKVKGHILKKNDCSHVKEMRYLSYIFVPINIILIIFEYINTKYGIDRMIEFLQENKYFTHVKICSACIYISTINLKLVKEGHIHKQFCPNTNCTTFYIDILQKGLVESKSQKTDVAHYFSDFQKIFDKNIGTDLYIFNTLDKDNYNLDMNNFLNLMISHGMKIIANIYEYYEEKDDERKKEKDEILDVYLSNLIENSLKYFNSEYKLLTGKEKERKCYKIAIHIPISIGIYLIFLGYTVYIYYSYIILIKDIHIF